LAIGLKGVDINMSVSDEIKHKLTEAFAPELLNVVNDSHNHAGHAGDDGTGETHFNVTIRAADLAAMNRVARHRAVHAALGADLIGRIHALALDIG
jgi:BolA family transcriptional regulator, general stress-responsive regulator